MSPIEQILAAYRTATNTENLVTKLRSILDTAHEYATVPAMVEIVDGLKPHIARGSLGALHSAVHIVDECIDEPPDWLSEASWRFALDTLDGKLHKRAGRHAQPPVEAEDMSIACETFATYELVKLANKKSGRRDLGTARQITAALVHASEETVKKRIAAAKKMKLTG